jgi:ammonia channel protein AmtB
MCGFDDPTDSFATYVAGSYAGVLLVAWFAHPDLGGSLAGYHMFSQAVVQLVALHAVAAWALIGTFVVGKVVALLCGGLRVPADVEDYGTDIALLEPDAYGGD